MAVLPSGAGNPSHRRQRWKVCYISQMQQEQPCLLLSSRLNSTFLGAWQKVFSGRCPTNFRNVSEHTMLPFLVCVFQTVTNELLIEFINNMASGWKMMRWREGDRGREGSLVSGGLGCWTGKDGDADKGKKKAWSSYCILINLLCFIPLIKRQIDNWLSDLRLTRLCLCSFQYPRAPVFTVPWRNCFATDFRVWLRKRLPHVSNMHWVVFFLPFNLI